MVDTYHIVLKNFISLGKFSVVDAILVGKNKSKSTM